MESGSDLEGMQTMTTTTTMGVQIVIAKWSYPVYCKTKCTQVAQFFSYLELVAAIIGCKIYGLIMYDIPWRKLSGESKRDCQDTESLFSTKHKNSTDGSATVVWECG